MSNKERIDVLLVQQGLAESRERAQRLIRAGLVFDGDHRLEKPGHTIDRETILRVKGADCPYVSRGGLKLEGALKNFGVAAQDRVVLDLGASTGGFTDCLLQNGARIVHAIDVGRGQLHEKLRADARVISREKTHLDLLQPGDFPEPPTLAVVDLSFISLRRAYPVLLRVLAPGAQTIALVKPQFEVGRDLLPRGGVVDNPALRGRVLEDLAVAAEYDGFRVLGRMESPIQGGDGNVEFFLWLEKKEIP